MTTEPTRAPAARRSRLRRVWEWAWRSERGRELKAKRATPSEEQALVLAKGFQRLAWRTLGGLEPLPATIRADVARPLVRAGLERCLPLLSPPLSDLAALFEEPAGRERLQAGGIPEKDREATLRWLTEDVADSNASTAQLGLQALNTLLDHLDHERRALQRLYWRRASVVALLAGALAAVVLAIVSLATPSPGQDVAIGMPWHASSAYPGFVQSGTKPENPKEGAFFCTNEEVEPWWTIDLRRTRTIDRLTILNRGDCCYERARPLVVEVSINGEKWKEVARIDDTFRTWRPKFKPTKARHVRVRALRRTFLHLRDVRIHAAD